MKISLSDGFTDAIIDAQDMILVSGYIWWPYTSANGGTYAYTQDEWLGSTRTIYMHRLILGLTDPSLIGDHINGNTLDNRRCNLRVATHSQNTLNSRRKRPKSGYFGVRKNGSKWQAFHYPDGKFKSLGQFADALAAAKCYDKAMMEVHGEFAIINGV